MDYEYTLIAFVYKSRNRSLSVDARFWLNADPVVHCPLETLFAAQISFRGLY